MTSTQNTTEKKIPVMPMIDKQNEAEQNTTEKRIPFISMALSSKKDELVPTFKNTKKLGFTRYEEVEVYGKKMYKAYFENKYCFFMSGNTKFDTGASYIHIYTATVTVGEDGKAEYSYLAN